MGSMAAMVEASVHENYRSHVDVFAAEWRALRRLSERVTVTDGGCWVFTGRVNQYGYGTASVGGRDTYVHRLTAAAAAGRHLTDYGREDHVLHSCDNPPCCNPAHLRWGTRSENMQDMHSRDRGARALRQWQVLCRRGHALVGANLDPLKQAMGMRQCLVCVRAARYVHKQAGRGRTITMDASVERQLSRTDEHGAAVAAAALSDVLALPPEVSAFADSLSVDLDSRSVVLRILPRLEVAEGGCWIHTGAPTGSYTQIRHKKKAYLVHRVMLGVRDGMGVTELPSDMLALHACDTPTCCNPAHLRWGTDAENVADMVERGRARSALLAQSPHCKRGHVLRGSNLLGNGTADRRKCRVCSIARKRVYRGASTDLTSAIAAVLSRDSKLAADATCSLD